MVCQPKNKGAEVLRKICGQIADKLRTPNAVFCAMLLS
nr:MAG TPA: hypothetical protein [Caudoviricetes sp.]